MSAIDLTVYSFDNRNLIHTIDVTVPIQPFDDLNLPKFYAWQFVTAYHRAVLNHGFPVEDQTTYLLISESDRFVFRYGSGEVPVFKVSEGDRRVYPEIRYVSDRMIKPGEVILGNDQGLCAKIVGNWNMENPIYKPVPAIVDNRIDVRMGYELNKYHWSNRYFFRYQLAVALSAIIASGWRESSTSIATSDELHKLFGTYGGGMIGAYVPKDSEHFKSWEARVDFLGSSTSDDVYIWSHTNKDNIFVIGDWVNVKE